MTPSELEKYLHDHIPLSLAMEVTVIESTTRRVVLGAPLAPNINHRETVFGGSASAVAILAAWSLVQISLMDAGLGGRLVIQRNTMNYKLPITGTFTATAGIPVPEAWGAFVRMLKRKGRARITVSSVLEQDGQIAGYLEGDFVALWTAEDGRAVSHEVKK